LEPKDIDTLLKLSEIYLRESNIIQAEKYINLAIEQDPDIPEAHVTLGRICEQRGDEDRAINHYK
jgi:Tfp pilus assembly protein PilF